jgi:predicted nucleic acid-binding protein
VSIFVVDASLVIKWFVPEINAEAARQWLEASHDYVAPDLLFAEIGNVVWKKVRRKELSEAEARQLVTDLPRLAVETVATRSLLQDALAVALTAGITAYDAMYLTLAVRLETQVITGDQRFVDEVARHQALAGHIRSLQHFVE